MNRIKTFLFNTVIPMVGNVTGGRNKFINVIYYHDIVQGEGYGSQKTNVELFKKQMQYIKDNGYMTFTFDELDDNIAYDKKNLLITFDDGWSSNYTEIFDFMKSLGIKYNIFLEAGNVGTHPEYLTWDMVREMHDSGVVGFGAHTYTHPDMSDLAKVDVDLEFTAANQKILQETGVAPKDFCYPYGKWSEQSNEYILNHTEYTRVYTSEMEYSYAQNGKIVFGRNSINGDRPFKVFVNMIKGNYNVFNLLRRKRHG